MKKHILLFSVLIITATVSAQPAVSKFNSLIKKADNYYRIKNYKAAAITYTQAFKFNKWIVAADIRYNAACVWALAAVPDSAFFQLNYIAKNINYSRYNQVTDEPDFNSLHKDKRWKHVIEIVKQNQVNKEAKLNKPLIAALESIQKDDQNYRLQLKETKEKFGANSSQLLGVWKIIAEKDSLNLIKVTAILDKQGWLGADVIGEEGNYTLFLVIQHSPVETQEKYLPMMRQAVKNGNAAAGSLALLEDRVLLRQGKKQIYGSQIITDPNTGKDTLYPIEDFPNVDKRRAAVGLQPLEEYAGEWGIVFKKRINPEAPLNGMSNDFATAIFIHDSVIGPLNVKDGYGVRQDIRIDNDTKENNSAWFKFTFDFDTILTFDIVPVNPKDDYDFVLFKCNNDDCPAKFKTKVSKPDRWCFSANFDKYGSTGLSQYVNQTHVGVGNGIGYVAGIPVKKGETCYLMVDWPYRWHSSGFTLYFYNLWPNKPKGFGKKPAVITLENVLFESNTAVLLKESDAALAKLVTQMNATKTMKIEIRGHTDNTGSEAENQKLSEERAKTVADYIASKNIDKNRLSFKGFGSKQPVTANDTDDGRKKNRRVEFVVVK